MRHNLARGTFDVNLDACTSAPRVDGCAQCVCLLFGEAALPKKWLEPLAQREAIATPAENLM